MVKMTQKQFQKIILKKKGVNLFIDDQSQAAKYNTQVSMAAKMYILKFGKFWGDISLLVIKHVKIRAVRYLKISQ